ncbi:magnesium-transporting ATPase (P-type) [Lysinibacillus parviboronicapiens]|uniref:Magnesium-transporting ATPase (P-type) n=1 Tax=Lysinibacillus parviboronicapiens TaxID=436516 RepID=A0ABV2PKW8_9BACI
MNIHFFEILYFILFYVILSLIYYRTAKANGYEEVAYLSFIPIINIYIMFLLIAKGNSDIERRASAKKMVILFTCLFIVGIVSIKLIVILIVSYLIYRIFYRWSGDKTYGIFYMILNVFTCGIFFIIYGLLHMNKPFRVA